MRMKRFALFAVAASVSLAACSSPVKLPDGVTVSAVSTACKQKGADETSDVFLLRDASGKPTRIEVSPSKRIADMGALICDMEGRLLGHSFSGEFPWDNKELVAKERARVDGLLGGAVLENNPAIAHCKDVR